MKLRRPGVRGVVSAIAIGAVLIAVGVVRWRAAPPTATAVIRRGPLTAQVAVTGKLRPIQSITYRPPHVGREAEIVQIVPEGTLVAAGDLLVRLDTTDLERDVQRLQQESRQLQLDVQVAAGEQEEAAAQLKNVAEGEGALDVEEVRTRLQMTEKKVERLRKELLQLTPLLEKGFITRDELAKTTDQLELAEEELKLARRRADIAVRLAHPRERQRAAVLLAQRSAQLEDVRRREQDAVLRLQALRDVIDRCTIHARNPGLVVYEEYLNASPRRKIRLGDRVAGSQGLVTIPEVHRMEIEASIAESQIHRVRAGLEAEVRLEAIPTMRLRGRVRRVGTLATTVFDGAFDGKRFEVIVELEQSHPELRPEMTARADVIVAHRESALLVPNSGVFQHDGKFVAYVDAAAGIEARHLLLGERKGALVEVIEGLREGERVLLTKPIGVSLPAENSPVPARSNANTVRSH